jgi:signal peptidase I
MTEGEKGKPARNRVDLVRRVIIYALVLGIGLMVFQAWQSFSFRKDVPENYTAMAPALPPGASIMIAHDLRSMEGEEGEGRLKLGDVIAYQVQDTKSGQVLPYYSRVVAGPGQTVRIKDGHALVDGERPPYLAMSITVDLDEQADPVEVPPGHVYVLNDNRTAPFADSRQLGPIPEEAISGKVVRMSVE